MSEEGINNLDNNTELNKGMKTTITLLENSYHEIKQKQDLINCEYDKFKNRQILMKNALKSDRRLLKEQKFENIDLKAKQENLSNEYELYKLNNNKEQTDLKTKQDELNNDYTLRDEYYELERKLLEEDVSKINNTESKEDYDHTIDNFKLKLYKIIDELNKSKSLKDIKNIDLYSSNNKDEAQYNNNSFLSPLSTSTSCNTTPIPQLNFTSYKSPISTIEQDISPDDKKQLLFNYCKSKNITEIYNLSSKLSLKDINCKDEQNNTPLYQSVIEGDKLLTSLLLNIKANPNIKCNNGNTVLHIAYKYHNSEIINMLLFNKANEKIKNNSFKIPIEEMNIKQKVKKSENKPSQAHHNNIKVAKIDNYLSNKNLKTNQKRISI